MLGLERVLTRGSGRAPRPAPSCGGTRSTRSPACWPSSSHRRSARSRRTATGTAPGTAAATAPSRTPSSTRRPTTTSTPASSTRSRSRAEFNGADPGAVPSVPLPPPDGVREDDRGRRLRRGRARPRHPHPHPPPPPRLAVQARPDDRGLWPTASRTRSWPARSRQRDVPITIQTYAWFARHGSELDRTRVPPRHLRRGAHGARREDERGDPRLPGAAVHRDDGDRAAHREAGLGRLPGLRRRPPARRRRPARPHRAAPLPARPARGGDQLGPDRRRRLRGARAGSGPRPPGAEPGGGEPLPRPLRLDARASSTRPASSTRTTSRRSSAPPV